MGIIGLWMAMVGAWAGLGRLPSLMMGGTGSKGSSKLGSPLETLLLKSGGGPELRDLMVCRKW
jgi:hypothetical protein